MSTKPATAKPVHDRKIPVIVTPEELKFVEGDPASYKQVLTLYNPYDFNIKFEGQYTSLGLGSILVEILLANQLAGINMALIDERWG